jgi:hypothetical protein
MKNELRVVQVVTSQLRTSRNKALAEKKKKEWTTCAVRTCALNIVQNSPILFMPLISCILRRVIDMYGETVVPTSVRGHDASLDG